MAQHLLDGPEVGAPFEQCGRSTVPESVRADVGGARDRAGAGVHDPPGRARIEPGATPAQEQRARTRRRSPASAARSQARSPAPRRPAARTGRCVACFPCPARAAPAETGPGHRCPGRRVRTPGSPWRRAVRPRDGRAVRSRAPLRLRLFARRIPNLGLYVDLHLAALDGDPPVTVDGLPSVVRRRRAAFDEPNGLVGGENGGQGAMRTGADQQFPRVGPGPARAPGPPGEGAGRRGLPSETAARRPGAAAPSQPAAQSGQFEIARSGRPESRGVIEQAHHVTDVGPNGVLGAPPLEAQVPREVVDGRAQPRCEFGPSLAHVGHTRLGHTHVGQVEPCADGMASGQVATRPVRPGAARSNAGAGSNPIVTARAAASIGRRQGRTRPDRPAATSGSARSTSGTGIALLNANSFSVIQPRPGTPSSTARADGSRSSCGRRPPTAPSPGRAAPSEPSGLPAAGARPDRPDDGQDVLDRGHQQGRVVRTANQCVAAGRHGRGDRAGHGHQWSTQRDDNAPRCSAHPTGAPPRSQRCPRTEQR